MNLLQYVDIQAGGPGSGCNPEVGVCGRPSKGEEKHGGRLSDGGVAKFNIATKSWVQDNGKPLPSHINIRIPPAWKDVRFATDPKSSVLVVGTDAKGRIQAVYSAAHAAAQAEAKFARIDQRRSPERSQRYQQRGSSGT